MNWLLRLYPARWRERYGEEFGAVLASQRTSPGLVLDVLAGAIDAHLYPQIPRSDIQQQEVQDLQQASIQQGLLQQATLQQSQATLIEGKDTMTFQLLQRCAAGGPKLSREDRQAAQRTMIWSALAMSALYMGLTKIYRDAPAVQALFYSSFPFLALVREQTAYLRKRTRATQMLLLVVGFSGMYLFTLGAFLLARAL
ncbi:MAG TPA: hypothetical protein VK722_02050 [Candidatus Aquilonibacter sp.]|jgi:hypothetical protein|nr:hypothetical protein [Candidatus Aquilonibacter sp.]